MSMTDTIKNLVEDVSTEDQESQEELAQVSDEEEVVEVQERAHTRGEPTYTQPTLNQGGSFESHPNWYKDLQGNSYPSKKS